MNAQPINTRFHKNPEAALSPQETISEQARRKHYGNAGFGRRTFLLPRYVFFLDAEICNFLSKCNILNSLKKFRLGPLAASL